MPKSHKNVLLPIVVCASVGPACSLLEFLLQFQSHGLALEWTGTYAFHVTIVDPSTSMALAYPESLPISGLSILTFLCETCPFSDLVPIPGVGTWPQPSQWEPSWGILPKVLEKSFWICRKWARATVASVLPWRDEPETQPIQRRQSGGWQTPKYVVWVPGSCVPEAGSTSLSAYLNQNTAFPFSLPPHPTPQPLPSSSSFFFLFV